MHKLDSAETREPAKQPFDPALDAPIVLTIDQLEKVAAGGDKTAVKLVTNMMSKMDESTLSIAKNV